MKLKAVFLDNDGTIMPEIPINANTETITLSDGVVEGLQLLQSNGYLLVIVTNQAGVAHGVVGMEDLDSTKLSINEVCRKLGIYLDGFYVCPHHPDGSVECFRIDCDCRKPRPGLILRAASDMDIDLASSWMIGDIVNDVEAGKKAGCKTILIDNTPETGLQQNQNSSPQFKVKDLAEAARLIVTTVN